MEVTNTRAPASVAPRIARFIVVSSLHQFWRRHISALPRGVLVVLRESPCTLRQWTGRMEQSQSRCSFLTPGPRSHIGHSRAVGLERRRLELPGATSRPAPRVTFAPRLRLNDLIERVPIESSGSRVGLLIDVFTQRRILSAFTTTKRSSPSFGSSLTSYAEISSVDANSGDTSSRPRTRPSELL